MSRVIFAPFSIMAGILAGMLGKKLFDRVWGLFDDQEAPDPKHPGEPMVRLIPALLIEGAIFRLARGLVDRGAREAWARLVGAWPGEKPEPA